MAIAVQTLTVALRGAQHPFPVVSLVDRRAAKRKTPARRKQFALTRGIERLLYGVTSKSTGAWAAHLDKHDLEEAVLVADKAAVDAGVLLQAELDAGEHPPTRSGLHACARPRASVAAPVCSQCWARCAGWWTSRREAACAAPRSCRSPSSARR